MLALAETNCDSDEDAREWSKGWKKASQAFWSLAPPRDGKRGGSHRGMAILLADTLGKTDAREIYNDPGGRGLAISARIHNRPTIIIAYHADSHSDEEQRDGFLALKSALPHDPTCDYIWLMDRNNIPNETLDYKHAQGAPNSIQRPLGIAAMHGCATHWGGMRDAYRALYPRRRQFTRQHAPNGEPCHWKRLDCVMVSTGMLGKQIPCVTTVKHLYPGKKDLAVLRSVGSTSKWSDHAAVQCTVRYTDTTKPPRTWTFPAHLLKDADVVNGKLREQVTAAQGGNGSAVERLLRLLATARKYAETKVKADTQRHRGEMQDTLKKLRQCKKEIGDEFGAAGSLEKMPDCEERRRRIAATSTQRDAHRIRLRSLLETEQKRWYADRGYTRHTQRMSRVGEVSLRRRVHSESTAT